MSFTLNGSPSVSLFWVRVPVLSEHSTSTPANSSMAANRVTIASFVASRRAPTAMVTDSTVGIATGMAATVRMSANKRTGSSGGIAESIGSPRKIADRNNHRYQCRREDDQVIADLQHGTLEMADGVRLLHQLRRLAEVGVRTRGVHHARRFRPGG